MDGDSSGKKRGDGGGGQSSNALVLLVTLLAGALLVRQIPLSDSRPGNAEPKAYESSAPAGVDARLWQDPIGAVARGIKEAGLKSPDAEDPTAIASGGGKGAQPKSTAPETTYSASAMAGRVHSWAQANAKQKPIIVGAMVPGGAYPGYAEWRRKARFAVVAGLKEMGFTPSDSEHLGFFFLDGPLRTQMLASYGAGVSRRSPRGQFFAYEWFDFAPGSASVQPNVTTDSDAGDQRLLLLWLDQDFFWEQPLDHLTRFFGFLLSGGQPGAKASESTPVIILGPGDSTLLRRMAAEARSDAPKTDASANAHPPVITPGSGGSIVVRRMATSTVPPSGKAPPIKMVFYDYSATAPDVQLLPAPDGRVEPKSVNEFFKQTPVTVFRTIGDDAMLACALRGELDLRGVRAPVPPNDEDISPEVVLVSELDTEYGRAISETTKSALVGARACPPSDSLPAVPAMQYAERLSSHWIKSYSYLRGVDGHLPQTQSGGSGASNTTKNGGEADKASSPASDDKRIERAEGQSQLDYLRRLALQLHAMDQSARAQGKPGIRAVGVLGSDVYDKLVVLQALRPTLPSAVFFTTDIDARLLHPTELGWTRNLIVASSYGLDLRPTLQAGNPPFRDVYQTSLYLSTLIALTNAEREQCWNSETACPVRQKRIDDWRGQPRLFELGLRGPVDLGARTRPEEPPDCIAVSQLSDCKAVNPRSPGLAPELPPLLWQLLFVAITIGLFVYLLARGAVARIRTWSSDPPLRAAGLHVSRKAVLVAAVVTSLATLMGIWFFLPAAVNGVAGFVTQQGKGVPISLLDGTSVLATELIRVVALVLAIWMICHGWRNLERNSELVTREMKWKKSRKALNDDVDMEYATWRWWQRVLHAFSFRLMRNDGNRRNESQTVESRKAGARTDPETGLRPEGEQFWRQYIYQGRIGARLLRVALAIIVYFLFATLVVMVFGFPDNPIRGHVIKRADLYLVYAVVLAMQFLVFFVIDATLLCRQFVMAVSRRNDEPSQSAAQEFDAVSPATRWPDPTLKHFAKKLNIGECYADQWVTIHVIGLRTKAVSKLIYFPYIIMSLAIVARSAVFDNWGMPLSLIIILGTSALIVTVSAVLLRWAAEYARRKATWRLGNELIRLNGTNNPADQHVAKQIELMIAQINRYDTGSFASYLDQPFVRAFLLPLGSVGGVGALQYLTIWHF